MMIEIAIMIEGQNGLNWARWQKLILAVEELGFAGLYRSDHFTNGQPPDLDSLELWTSLTWLADHTRRIEFGPLVTPVSFRHPVMTARIAAAVDDLSNGRLRLGLGAGWQEREHNTFGYDLLNKKERFDRFEEGLEVITRLLRSREPVSYSGHYYSLAQAELLPHPQKPGSPAIVIGGNGEKLTLPLVARFADEWNAVLIPAETFKTTSAKLDELLRQAHRQPGDVRRTLMASIIFGRSPAEVEQKCAGRSRKELHERGAVVGQAGEVKEQLAELEAAGVQRVMLQWLDLDDLPRLEALAKALL
jgi:F420-dependent oxidoreductase-like protein